VRLPLAITLKNRADDTEQDARMVNAFAEASSDPATGERLRLVKRPGLESAYTVAAGKGQAIFTWTKPGPLGPEETLVAITDDIINTAPTVLAKKLVWGVQPTESELDTAITPAVTVRILSQAGNLMNSTATVVISLGTNPTGATLGGDVSNAAVAGVATFNDLELDRSGEGFRLAASSSGLMGATSAAFSIPTELVFTVQPAFGQPGETLDPIEVTAQDSGGNTDTNYTGEITLSLYSQSDPAAVLSGTLTVSAVAGIASFANVEIDVAGTYTLKAEGEEASTAAKPASAISDSFAVGVYTLTSAQGNITPDTQQTGFIFSFIGSISPTDFEGATFLTLATNVDLPIIPASLYTTTLSVVGAVAQDAFTSISIGGKTLLSASAGYITGAATNWVWTGLVGTDANFVTATGVQEVEIA
jgi:hypothetical protein